MNETPRSPEIKTHTEQNIRKDTPKPNHPQIPSQTPTHKTKLKPPTKEDKPIKTKTGSTKKTPKATQKIKDDTPHKPKENTITKYYKHPQEPNTKYIDPGEPPTPRQKGAEP